MDEIRYGKTMKKSFGESLLRILMISAGAILLGVFGNLLHPKGILLQQPIYSIAEQGQCTDPSLEKPPLGIWKKVSVQQAQELLRNQSMTIGDIRGAEEYTKNRILGAIHLPCQAEQGRLLLKSAQKKGALFLYDQLGNSQELTKAVQAALQSGISLVYTLEGGFSSWQAQQGAVETGLCEHCGLGNKQTAPFPVGSFKEKLGNILPLVNACLNGVSLFFLGLGFWLIKRKNRKYHQYCMLSAFGTSVVFLVCYLLRIYLTGTHRFPHEGLIKWVYFVILFSHMILAAITPILAIYAIYLAFRNRYELHRKIVRFAWPMWVYVSMTGIIVYLMLYHFPQ